jgi:hypothetical protein
MIDEFARLLTVPPNWGTNQHTSVVYILCSLASFGVHTLMCLIFWSHDFSLFGPMSFTSKFSALQSDIKLYMHAICHFAVTLTGMEPFPTTDFQ